ncbi:MAG: int [Proteobacteria bacterium]|nr:int [Pseudomonadota bacterium]
MRYIINHKVVLSRPPEGPVASHLSSFAQWVSEQGYAANSLWQRVHLAACFSQWLGKQRVRLPSISTEHPRQYLKHRARRVRPTSTDSAALRQLMDFLRRQGLIGAEKQSSGRLSAVEQCLNSFERYLSEERSLSTATIVNYVPFIRSFLDDRFGNNQVRIERLCASDIVRFVQRAAPRLHLKRAKLLTSALRSFLQYARYRGLIALDLAAAVPTVANWSMTSIPRAIPPDQVRQLLASINRHTAMGRRDYAVLLLLSRLGLRSSEVAFLELDDIDWKAGRFSVRGKSGRRTDLPLPDEVGKALADYLQHGRPQSASRRVFLRARAPLRGFLSQCAIGSIVKHTLGRAGIIAPTKGAHQFRHGLATEMLRRGASLAEIGEVLGHRSAETTKIYTKVDLDALRRLALPWPGGVR